MEKETTKQIFVIEDNKTEGMLLKLCLGSMKNISVTNFTYGEDLIKNLDKEPEIIIADMMLPDIPGDELIHTIKETCPKTEVIVVSAQRDTELIAKVQKMGVYNYLVKSETCMEYLQKAIEDLTFLIDNHR
ncbi:MAG: response regulator [Bacteroidetes bacterium]|nr:MAG: response regulator [Bacteroidota bacterium]